MHVNGQRIDQQVLVDTLVKAFHVGASAKVLAGSASATARTAALAPPWPLICVQRGDSGSTLPELLNALSTRASLADQT